MRSFSRRLAGATLLATSIAIPAAPGAWAAETVHLYFRSTGPIKMVGNGEAVPTESMSLNIATKGLTTGARYRLVGSARSCGRAHVRSATVFEAPLGRADRSAIVRIGKSTPVLSEVTSTRSVRLFTQHSGGTQVSCARVVPVAPGVPDPAISFNFERVEISYVRGAIRGVVAVERDDDEASVSTVLTGLPSGSTSRIVGATATCDRDGVVDGSDFLIWQRSVANAAGVAALIDRPVNYASLGRENSIECHYLMRGPRSKTPRTAATSFVFHTITWN